MHEVLIQVLRLLRGAWRYRWWMLGVAWAVCLVGWTIVARMPDEYRASARVYVDTSSVLAPYLRGLTIGTTDSARKISLMTRTLLSRPNLEKVMRMTDLDLRAVDDQDTDRIVGEIRSKLRFAGTSRENLYTINYTDESPELAKLMVKSLLTIFMESNLGEVRKDQDSASQFLEQQLEDYEQRMRDLETQAAEHKHRNYALLPGDVGGYYESLRETKEKIHTAKLELQVAEQRLNAVRREVEGEEPTFGMVGPTLPPKPKRAKVKFETPELDQRISSLKTRLDDLLVRYTDRHPDVMSVRRKIEDLEVEREKAIAQLRKEYRPEPEQVANGPRLEENPLYQQMRLSLVELEANVAARRTELQSHQERLAELETALDKVLAIEARQNELQQELAIAKRSHSQLLERLESAKLGRKADDSSESVRFRVIDPPRVPATPSGPNRVLFSSIVLAAGLGIGFALAFLMSQLRPTFDDRQMMNVSLGLPVLGSVNMVWTSDQVRARKVRNVSFVFSLTGLLLAFGVVLALYQFNIDLLPRLAQSLNLA